MVIFDDGCTQRTLFCCDLVFCVHDFLIFFFVFVRGWNLWIAFFYGLGYDWSLLIAFFGGWVLLIHQC